MIELRDGMLLYHGSYIGIPQIDLDRCFSGLDFGRGFYLTSSAARLRMTKQPEPFSAISAEQTLVLPERRRQTGRPSGGYCQTDCRISSVSARRML